MKYAHLADCHIGAWRDAVLSELNSKSFSKAIDICIEKKLDFILISGDLFNTSLPGVDKLKLVVQKLKVLKDIDIPVYIIAGSHDFSPSGKTMLDILEEAGLVINVVRGEVVDDKLRLKFTIDKKTGVKITGMLGKKGGLEKNYYSDLDRTALENEPGTKIFMFHTLLSELKPKTLEHAPSEPLSFLPKGFSYYAGGHPHFVFSDEIDGYGRIAYPGPIFPNNFKELEELQHGGFYLVDDEEVSWIPVKLHDVHSIVIDCSHKTPDEVASSLKSIIEKTHLNDKIVTVRLSGVLEHGRVSDIPYKELYALMDSARVVLRNTSALSSKDFEEIKISVTDTHELENNLIDEHCTDDETKDNARKLFNILETEKMEGETKTDYDKRVIDDIDKVLQ